MKTDTLSVLLEGFTFGECPRWHDGKLFFSDIFGGKVLSVDPTGKSETLFSLETRPSGLGWDRDGKLLVVSMRDRKLLRWDGSELSVAADLARTVPGDINDMVVDATGRAYIGNFGFDLFAGETARTTFLTIVEPDGEIRTTGGDLTFPNGMVITPDGKTLVVAETFADKLSAFDVAADGSLSNKRTFATVPQGTGPDGICLDAEGAVWVSGFTAGKFLRVKPGGEITAEIALTGKRAVACMLGGADRRTLHLCTAETTLEELHHGHSKGRIETARVDVPGAGFP